ncbi:MAG: flagellar hook protein FlgE [Gammaproteobacteria bacterium]|nr:flagellar hook protein FlgE [Gammaproteobacteria bacterium]
MISRIASTGLNAAYKRLSTTANNIANSQTTGFKQARAEYTTVPNSQGVKVSGIRNSTSNGVIQNTSIGTDLAISGNGYFQVSRDGKQSFTRAGAFSADREGYLTNSQGQRLMGFTPQSAGTPVALNVNTGAHQPQATGNINLNLNIDATGSVPSGAFDSTDPATFNNQTSTTAYDSLGSQHQVDFFFRKTATPNQVEMFTQVDGNPVGGAQTLTFDTSGNLTSPSGGVSLPGYTPSNGAATMNLNVNADDVTQTGSPFAVNGISQDGNQVAELSNLSVDGEGNVVAEYADGSTVTVGRLAVAGFSNPQGLSQEGDGLFSASASSGDPIYNSSTTGSIQSGALEGSNVNLEEQAVNLISTEQHAKAMMKMIQAEDDMLGTLFKDKA